MKKRHLSILVLVAACAGPKKGFDYCKEMTKTGDEIVATQEKNRDLKQKLNDLKPGSDSVEEQRFALTQQIDKNEEKIRDLKNYNKTNEANCGPAMFDPQKEQKIPGGGNY